MDIIEKCRECINEVKIMHKDKPGIVNILNEMEEDLISRGEIEMIIKLKDFNEKICKRH